MIIGATLAGVIAVAAFVYAERESRREYHKQHSKEGG